jgi:hypothetical protein
MYRTRLPHRSMILSPALLAMIFALPGCGGGGGGSGEFAQEFEKPDAAPAPAVVDPPDTGEDLSPRDRRD